MVTEGPDAWCSVSDESCFDAFGVIFLSDPWGARTFVLLLVQRIFHEGPRAYGRQNKSLPNLATFSTSNYFKSTIR